ncbi:[protein-PII] uridylyltransferase [Corynebacterium pygosceleis]|uniref:[protein-PII] uridylyltransferase n=1 Tax=Corynebacterium pygosceleis TaxID=2800406 RepID=UPI002004449A|nr:[protein-PII] uridylyltransferase [Corynebacterium pygosceleis]MCK7674211.1 [protein-PII] uridylyltransferase [Corynebacterium pygosceleis]
MQDGPADGPAQPDAPQLRETAFTRALGIIADIDIPAGCALAATGSLARGELTPQSDIDLMLLHTGPPPAEAADIWYPVWDAHIRLDHSVRTPTDCVNIVDEDTTAALGLLDLCHLAGDEDLLADTRNRVLQQWRRTLPKRFNHITDTAIDRWRRSGSVVAMTHPDLKHGRGGLRDGELIAALALGNLCDAPPLADQRGLLLDIRTLLHDESRRPRDVLDPEFAHDIALRLGYPDRYELARAIARAARATDDALTNALATARSILPTPGGIRRTPRRPLDVDVVDGGGYITLSRSPDMDDPCLVLRVAAAAARTGLPVPDAVWEPLRRVPPLPDPWPAHAADDFVALLSSPEHTETIIDGMDRHGLWTPLVPEWSRIRGLMPRERSHVHTIDRHLIATVRRCAESTVDVPRPDLLLLTALIHDIGKGGPRPHSQVGAEIIARMTARMGLGFRDRCCAQNIVAQHTTLMKFALRRDPTDPETVRALLDAVGYDLLTLDLLQQLTRADALSTGPGVWTPHAEQAVNRLAAGARRALTAVVATRPFVTAPTPLGLTVRDNGELRVHWRGSYQREMVRVLALIAAKGWNIQGSRMVTDPVDGSCRAEFDVRPRAAKRPSDVDEGAFIQAYASGVFSTLPEVRPAATATAWTGRTLEVRTIDRPGVIGAVMGVLPEIDWMEAATPGATMVARFRLRGGNADRARIERDVNRVLNAA